MTAGPADLTWRLERLEQLLGDAGEPRWQDSMRRLRTNLTAATTEAEQQAVLRQLLGVYGGMGSFSDVVLQDRRGVRAEQQELHRLRSELFEAARDRLS